MAELKFKILGDLSGLKKDLEKLLKEKFKVNVGGSGGGGSGAPGAGSKKGLGLLSGILKGIAPLALLLSLKPIKDLLELIMGFVMIGIIQIVKLLIALGQLFIAPFKSIIESGKLLIEFVKKILPGLKEALGVVKDRITQVINTSITWIKSLPGKIWGFIVEGFNWIVEGIKIGWEVFKQGITNIGNWFSDLWTNFKEVVNNVWAIIKVLPGKIWAFLKIGFNWIKDKVVSVWNAIKALPLKIWNYLKDLAGKIASEIKKILPKFLKPKDSIKDGIIKPDGTVIKTDPNDFIIATQNPGSLGGKNVTINNYGVMPREMVEYIRNELGTSNIVTRF